MDFISDRELDLQHLEFKDIEKVPLGKSIKNIIWNLENNADKYREAISEMKERFKITIRKVRAKALDEADEKFQEKMSKALEAFNRE